MLAVNAWNESKAEVEKYVKKNNLEQRILMDGRDVAHTYAVSGVPTVFWIDPAGRAVDVLIGYNGPDDLEEKTKAFLAAQAGN